MHQSAIYYGKMFFETYCNNLSEDIVIAEIGSQNVNGSLRDVAPIGCKYLGLDFVSGNGVDIIIDDPYKLPLEDDSVDIVVTSSCFEHSEFFWLVILEALRVLKNDGIIYLNAPSNGFVHRWPVDCWRFYPDSGHALVNWAKRCGMNSILLESFIGQKSEGEVSSGGAWNDFVAVILKNADYIKKYDKRIISSISGYTNGYSSDITGVINDTGENPDSTALIAQEKELKKLSIDKAQLLSEIDRLNKIISGEIHIDGFLEEGGKTNFQELNKTVLVDESVSKITLLSTELNLLKEQNTLLKNNCDLLEDKNKELTNESEKLAKLTAELEAACGLLQGKVDSYYIDMQRVYHSLSWKVSYPIRVVSKLIKMACGLLKSISSRLFSNPLRKIFKLCNSIYFGIKYYGSISTLLKKSIGAYRREGLRGLKFKINRLLLQNNYIKNSIAQNDTSSAYSYAIAEDISDYAPLVTIIVPNFNHGKYLRERLDSIYNQTYKNIEVILLDDKSSDDSQMILTEYAEKYKDITRLFINEKNSGGVFFQWKKGFSLAKGELIWVAESDDYCDLDFLTVSVNKFRNEAVMLSFCRTIFVSGEQKQKIWSSDEYLEGLSVKNTDKEFIRSAHRLVNDSWGVGNLVANVSSALFRNPGDLGILSDENWYSMKVCGDWVFYLHLIRGGLVSYTPNTTNYYRQHEKNTSTSNQARPIYYQEYEVVAKQLLSMYKVNDSVLPRLEAEVKKQWHLFNSEKSGDELSKYFDLNRIVQEAKPRKPNLLMGTYALAAGGGETFPILLANVMKKNGYSVTLLNWFDAPTEAGVRSMLDKNIPLLQHINREQLALIANDLGIEVTHSHHACVDLSIASLLSGCDDIARVISMHGMYEMIPEKERKHPLTIMSNSIHRVVYTAQKNLAPFSIEFQKKLGFVKINNALPKVVINHVDAASLNIEQNDFVVCLVSRAIPEKGWEEAIEAVNLANLSSDRHIHLLLIGEGPSYDALAKSKSSATIHFLGFRSNIRDYYNIADIGLLPSRFKGESFPLVLIDCLLAGKPVVASDVGEISEMIQSPTGDAGLLFSLNDWQIPVRDLADILVELSKNNSDKYKFIKTNVASAAAKFSEEKLFEAYDDVYITTINKLKNRK